MENKGPKTQKARSQQATLYSPQWHDDVLMLIAFCRSLVQCSTVNSRVASMSRCSLMPSLTLSCTTRKSMSHARTWFVLGIIFQFQKRSRVNLQCGPTATWCLLFVLLHLEAYKVLRIMCKPQIWTLLRCTDLQKSALSNHPARSLYGRALRQRWRFRGNWFSCWYPQKCFPRVSPLSR